MASKIYLPFSYDKIRNKKEFQEFIHSVQSMAHEQSFANDEAMDRHSQLNPQVTYNIFMAYLESIICTENDNKVLFEHNK